MKKKQLTQLNHDVVTFALVVPLFAVVAFLLYTSGTSPGR